VTTHAELVLRAVRWLRNTRNCNPVYAEMGTQSGEIPDAIGWRNGRSHVVEAKVSRADLFADKKKAIHGAGIAMGRQRWILVPAGLVKPDEVPESSGLLYAHARSVVAVKDAPARDIGETAAIREALMLASAIRRLELGTRFDANTGRWEGLLVRMAREQADTATPVAVDEPEV